MNRSGSECFRFTTAIAEFIIAKFIIVCLNYYYYGLEIAKSLGY